MPLLDELHRDVFPLPEVPAWVLSLLRFGLPRSAKALRAYVEQVRNRQLEFDAAEIRIRAERRVGELMQGRRHDDRLE